VIEDPIEARPPDRIEDRIRAFIAASAGLAAPPGDADRLVELGYMPSIQLLELVAFLEDEFRIALRPTDLVPENLATVAEIAAVVRARLTATRRAPPRSS
jgi:acyl carrier protein